MITPTGPTNDSDAIHSDPPAGNMKKITNAWLDLDTGLPNFAVEA